jgi:hypothetical protein
MIDWTRAPAGTYCYESLHRLHQRDLGRQLGENATVRYRLEGDPVLPNRRGAISIWPSHLSAG